MSTTSFLHWLVAFLLAGIFLPSAWSKLRAIDEFTGIVADYRLLPGPLVEPVARLLPILEVATGLLVLLPPVWPVAAALATGLLLLFALAMAINLARGRREIDCGCYLGRQKERIGWPLVVRNLLLAAASLVLLAPAGAMPGPVEWVTIALASGSLLALYAAFSRLAGLAPVGRVRRA
ncbi:MAG: hypothetical protein KatS3mg117_1559 [Geminicoccaceae bacterium]|nr:MAG: hypothetical protein KatS3mg117_1559 [Geminicoccaceae bacterium]